MSKFVETTYLNKTEILKFPDHYVALAVTVDDTGIVANTDGKKIVPAGTPVGGATGSVLADASQKVQKKNTAPTAPVKASVTLDCTNGNADIVITAVEAGTAGNGIKVQLKNPAGNNQALTVDLVDNAIVVSLATGVAGAITSTAAEVIAAINASLEARVLVVAANATGSDGTGVVNAIAATALIDGSAGSAGVTEAEGLLLSDVDVTYGSAPGAMLIHGFVALGKLPETPDAGVIAALKQITFIA